MSILPFKSFAEEFFQTEGVPSPREIAHLRLKGGMELAFFPSVGPLFPCHTLLVPEEPVHSYAELDEDDLVASFEAAVELRRLMKEDQEESIVIGEHGATSTGSCKLTPAKKSEGAHHGGACTDHAHLHFSTCRGSPLATLDNYMSVGGKPEVLTHPRDMKQLQGQPYFMFCPFPQGYPDRLQIYVWNNPQDRFGDLTRQFFRRAVYAAGHGLDIRDMRAGGNEGWDWRKHPDIPEVWHISRLISGDFLRPNYYADPDATDPKAKPYGKIVEFKVHQIAAREK